MSADAQPLPPALESMRGFHQLRQQVDTLAREAWEHYQDKMQCRAGCSSCCRGDFRISLVEALEIRTAVAQLPQATQARLQENLQSVNPGRCPLLIDEQCSIYASRPLICRIFGFPITDGETIATCELNFQDEQAQELFSAKSFNKPALAETLMALSRLYLEEVGHPCPSDMQPPVFFIQEILQGH